MQKSEEVSTWDCLRGRPLSSPVAAPESAWPPPYGSRPRARTCSSPAGARPNSTRPSNRSAPPPPPRLEPTPIPPAPSDPTGLSVLAPTPAALKQNLATPGPLGGLGLPGVIAAAVAFLASGQSSFITVSSLYVDGGLNQI